MVKIRLKRMGAIKRPFYRVVVADSRSPRDGRFIEAIGKYHPLDDPSVIDIDADRAMHWLTVGAQPSEQVQSLLKVTGVWAQFEAARPSVKAKAEAEAKTNQMKQAKAEVEAKEAAKAAAKAEKTAAKKAEAKAEPAPAPAPEPEAAPAEEPKAEVASAPDEPPADEAPTQDALAAEEPAEEPDAESESES